jgi:hypothetical protein
MDWRTCIGVSGFRTGDKSIGQAESIGSVWSVGAVYAYTAFSLTNSPLNRIDDETCKEVQKKPWKMDVKRLFFFLRKFGFNCVHVCSYGWMVVIIIASFKINRWTLEVALQWDSLRADAKAP